MGEQCQILGFGSPCTTNCSTHMCYDHKGKCVEAADDVAVEPGTPCGKGKQCWQSVSGEPVCLPQAELPDDNVVTEDLTVRARPSSLLHEDLSQSVKEVTISWVITSRAYNNGFKNNKVSELMKYLNDAYRAKSQLPVKLTAAQIYVDRADEALNWGPNNLAAFSQWVVQKQQSGVIRDDVAAVHLLSGPNPSGRCGGIGGIAYVRTLCQPYYQTGITMITGMNSLCAYDPFPLVAHELGHNFGMPHLWENSGPPQGSSGYLMDYGDFSRNSFHPNSVNTAVNSLASFRCLRNDGSTSNPTNPENPSCQDSQQDCKYWASIGECSRNSAYMSQNCKAACNKCGSTSNPTNPTNPENPSCQDRQQDCKYWASIGECSRNSAYMSQNCK